MCERERERYVNEREREERQHYVKGGKNFAHRAYAHRRSPCVGPTRMDGSPREVRVRPVSKKKLVNEREREHYVNAEYEHYVNESEETSMSNWTLCTKDI